MFFVQITQNKVMPGHVLALLCSVSCLGSDKHYKFSNHLKFVFLIEIWTFPVKVIKDWHYLSQFKDDSNFTMLTSHLHTLTQNVPP